MFHRSRTITTLGLLLMTALTASAQRPRMSNDDASKPEATTPPAPAPQTVKAKYEGGVFGYPKKDRKSTRLNSSHRTISYAVFCLKKKKIEYSIDTGWIEASQPELDVRKHNQTYWG